MKTLILLGLLSLVLFAKEGLEHKHTHKHTECEKPIVIAETQMEKIFELKGKIYKILKGDEMNPTLLYIHDTDTNKCIQIKQK